MIKIAIACFVLSATHALAQNAQKEDFYANIWCAEQNGLGEVKTAQNTRIDCLTEEYAVEVDFDTKWAEGLGQALHYSAESGKKAAVLIIVQNHNQKDRTAYLNRLQSTIAHHQLDVTVFTIETKDYALRD
jgi:hypothetical protein